MFVESMLIALFISSPVLKLSFHWRNQWWTGYPVDFRNVAKSYYIDET